MSETPSGIPVASISGVEQLKDKRAVATLLAAKSGFRADALTDALFDRGELTLTIDRHAIVAACQVLKPEFNFLSDVTCVDWYPNEPRFHVVYQLLSHKHKEQVRLVVQLSGDAPTVDSIVPVWPAANFFEREVFDLFGVRFSGHPDLRRIMMPDDWKGHPLRKDYPVEGYR